MNINNGQLLSLLFDQPKLKKALNQAIPYISVSKTRTILNLRCASIATLSTLLQYRQEIFKKINPLLGYEICLECEETGDNNMVATAERITEQGSATERFLSLETLAKATSKSPQEVKMLLGRAKEVIHPTEDGAEMITEAAFDGVVLQWARSFKEENGAVATTTQAASATTSKPRKPSAKILISELAIADIMIIKTGANAGLPNLASKSVQYTLENFFNKVKLEDTTKVDALSAFIEGTSEFGQALRKKILAAYKKFTKGGNPQEIQDRLIDGAKAYLESMAAVAAED
ncbi:MAG TPA: hypothetical protein VE944_22490 [Nostoc sp.]|uniref:hypothetical protein n=1 Tax=Nostoc sp. TaxID=1180 RepID=UPI002D33A881|nr:hypothetical protein [Nostoc sp.]HYX17066.1 hypothetical protein [Nostoc sp.]